MVSTKFRIMIVDNDSGQIETLSSALKKQDDFEIISVVSTRETAIKLLSQ